MKNLHARERTTRTPRGIQTLFGAARILAVLAVFVFAIWLLTVLRITPLQAG